jgi:hypothetical protein
MSNSPHDAELTHRLERTAFRAFDKDAEVHAFMVQVDDCVGKHNIDTHTA